jgi:hypothetical protein
MYLKKILVIIALSHLLVSCSLKCRNPEEIKTIKPINDSDIHLNCPELALEMIKAQAHMLKTANQKEEIEAYAVMPHCLHTTLMQAERALNSAKTRVEYINYLQSHKKCQVGLGFQRSDTPDVVNQIINEEGVSVETEVIRHRKIAPIKATIPTTAAQ